jgi:hypothetical protein
MEPKFVKDIFEMIEGLGVPPDGQAGETPGYK